MNEVTGHLEDQPPIGLFRRLGGYSGKPNHD